MIEPRCYLHRAPYVVPVHCDRKEAPILLDGAVLTEDGRIKQTGRFKDLQNSNAVLVDHEEAVLMPAMVNCHSHLELSHLAFLGKNSSLEADSGLPGWIKGLLNARESDNTPQEEKEMAAWQALARLYAGGCRSLIDIGNLPESRKTGDNFKVQVDFFQEFLGLTAESTTEAISRIDHLPRDFRCTAHAPYSASAKLLTFLKNRSRKQGHKFPVHVAESIDELEFFATGEGRLRDFLEDRNVWDGSFKAGHISPVAYLAELGVLDKDTLCVHCVHVNDKDIALLRECEATVCVCAGSNRYLKVGQAPVRQMLDRDIRLVIGTDSLASNPHLSLWEEMKVIAEDNPDIDPCEIIRMATRNGAEFMGIDHETGSLDPDCSASFLAVRGNLAVGATPEKVMHWLVSTGLDIETEWVE